MCAAVMTETFRLSFSEKKQVLILHFDSLSVLNFRLNLLKTEQINHKVLCYSHD